MTGYEAIRSDAAWVDLSDRGRLAVIGEDAGRLLHALSSNDIKNLDEGCGLYAFFLTAQGRILADANIFRRPDMFLLDTEPETGAKLRDHIDKYIIADDATVEAIEAWSELSIEGPRAFERAAALGLPVPEKTFATGAWETGFTARVGYCTPDGVRVFGPEASVASLRQRLGMPQVTSGEARVVQLENGIPRYGEDISERYLVQETGRLHGVHFSKGCYLGQEIVERVRSRAQVHRHLHPLRIATQSAPAPGTKLSHGGSDVGEITSAVYSPSLQEVVALAYVRTEPLQQKATLSAAGAEAHIL